MMEEHPLYELDGGVGDILYVYSDRVVIRHKGVLNFFAMGIKGDKTIYLSDISSVQLKKAGFTAGYLQFSLPGGNENEGGVFGAAQDENTITFNNKSNALAETIAEFLNKELKKIKSGKNNSTNTVSVSDELLKLKELLDSRIISQEEFDKAKISLLSKL